MNSETQKSLNSGSRLLSSNSLPVSESNCLYRMQSPAAWVNYPEYADKT